MERVLLLSIDALKKNTPIQNNVDDKLLKPYIYKAQETHIHQILGTNLYDRILNDVKTGAITGNYKNVLDKYIQPALIEWSFYEALPFIQLKITNKTIGKGNADYLAESDLNDLKYLRQTVRDVAEFYGTRLITYLKENNELFPEYNTNSGLDKIIPNSKSYFSGVYLGGGRSSDCNWGLGDKWRDII